MHVTAHELGVARAVSSHLITNCQETYIQALALGIPEERVNLFQNGVDTEVFTPGKPGKKLRDLINVSPGNPLVGFVGRLEYEKGPDLFIRAAGYIHHVMPGVRFVVVGSGSMLKQLKQSCKQLRLERHVSFADWANDTSEVYAALDLLVHTSRSDGTSLVVQEAMACGKPVVGMAVGGVREMIENEHTGMLVQKDDWEELGKQVIDLLQQPKVLKQMAAAARKRAEECFNVLNNTRQTAKLLQQLASSFMFPKVERGSNYRLLHLNGNGLATGKQSNGI
jgi:glycosyltransferase involved in cell wall biosynthesis